MRMVIHCQILMSSEAHELQICEEDIAKETGKCLYIIRVALTLP